MATSGTPNRRTARAPKPLSVPAIAALLGAIIFFAGIPLGSYDVQALGMIFILWGILSLSILLIRRRRATRA